MIQYRHDTDMMLMIRYQYATAAMIILVWYRHGTDTFDTVA